MSPTCQFSLEFQIYLLYTPFNVIKLQIFLNLQSINSFLIRPIIGGNRITFWRQLEGFQTPCFCLPERVVHYTVLCSRIMRLRHAVQCIANNDRRNSSNVCPVISRLIAKFRTLGSFVKIVLRHNYYWFLVTVRLVCFLGILEDILCIRVYFLLFL